mgnify:FL=1
MTLKILEEGKESVPALVHNEKGKEKGCPTFELDSANNEPNASDGGEDPQYLCRVLFWGKSSTY